MQHNVVGVNELFPNDLAIIVTIVLSFSSREFDRK